MLTAIIVAGGTSRRMGFDKTFALLAGKPVIAHTIAAFEATSCVDEIIVVGRDDRLAELREIVAENGFRKVKELVSGGRARQDSVVAGLRCVGAGVDFVAIQDAARPLIEAAQIEMVYHAARAHDAAALAAPIADTLKRAGADHMVSGSVDRENLFAMQTPQIFRRALLGKAFAAIVAENLSVTDDVSAVERLGHKVVLVPNESINFKITYPRDLALAELVLRVRSAEATPR